MTIGQSVIYGIISGFIASAWFSIFLGIIKPRIKISDKMCIQPKRTKDNKRTYKIKIVNHTFTMLTNLKYSLHYCTDFLDGTTDIIEIPPRKMPLTSCDKFSLFKKNSDYALRFTYEIDEDTYPLKENNKFIFTLLADHAYSNTTKCIKKVYKKENTMIGNFETGKSTKIIIVHED